MQERIFRCGAIIHRPNNNNRKGHFKPRIPVILQQICGGESGRLSEPNDSGQAFKRSCTEHNHRLS